MQYRQLGNSGVRVSVVGLGTNRFGNAIDQNDVNSIIDAAEEMGVNFIDTADVYAKSESETTLGNALKGRWDKFVLATKVYFETGSGTNDRGASRYHIINGVEASLKRLQTDHIDLYQIHRWDTKTPIAETLRTLDDLVSSGKVCYIGASTFAAWQLAKANLLAEFNSWTPFVTVQSHYHLFEREVEREVIPYCRAHNVGFIPFFPLAGGFLTGKYKRGEAAPAGSRGESSSYVQQYMTDKNYDILEKLEAWVTERDRTLSEFAIAWLMAQPQVCSVISGLTKLAHLEQNVKAADWNLTPQELIELDDMIGDGPVHEAM